MDYVLFALAVLSVVLFNLMVLGLIDEFFLDSSLSSIVKKWLDKKLGDE